MNGSTPEKKLAGIREEGERRRIDTSNSRDFGLTAIDRLPEIATSLPLHNVEIRADILGDLMRVFSGMASTARAETSKLKEKNND